MNEFSRHNDFDPTFSGFDIIPLGKWEDEENGVVGHTFVLSGSDAVKFAGDNHDAVGYAYDWRGSTIVQFERWERDSEVSLAEQVSDGEIPNPGDVYDAEQDTNYFKFPILKPDSYPKVMRGLLAIVADLQNEDSND